MLYFSGFPRPQVGLSLFFINFAGNMSDHRPKIIFRADAGGNIGFGHLVRSAALASWLASDFDCSMVCRNSSPEAEPFISGVIHESGITRLLTDVPADMPEQEFDSMYFSLLGKDVIAVVDGYRFSASFQEEAARRSRALVTVDDLPDRRFPADIFFSPSPLRRDEVSLPSEADFYAGPLHSFLRKPFLRPVRERSRHDIKRVLIAIGGADPLGLTGKIISAAREVLPDAELDIIAGPTVTVNPEDGAGIRIHRNLSAEEVCNLIDGSDFGIFPASNAGMEALARRLPIAVGWYVGNQKRYYDAGVAENLFAPLGDLRDERAMIVQRLKDAVLSSRLSEKDTVDFNAWRKQTIEIFKQLWRKKEIR